MTIKWKQKMEFNIYKKPTVTGTIVCSTLDEYRTSAINYLTDSIQKFVKGKKVNIIQNTDKQ
jgi:hypothetical protein